MLKVFRFCGVAALAGLAAACVSQERIALEAAIPPYPEPYRAALQGELRYLAEREATRGDYADAKRFLLRAEAAARAVVIRPLEVEDYEVKPQERAELVAARARLVTLFDGGRARAPEALARAHASFECWLEEAEEGHQPGDIAWCRDRFEGGVTATRRDSGLDADWGIVVPGEGGHIGAITLKGQDGADRLLDTAHAAGFVHETGDARGAAMTPRETTKFTSATLQGLPPAAEVYIVYFASGSNRLDNAGRAAVAAAADDAANRVAVDVEVLGFADRAGDDRSNLQLSKNRVAAVHAAMLGAGVPEDAFLLYSRGEAAPAISTPDGVPERRNRRVEVTVR